MKISHSAAQKYQLCPKSYEYHYVKRIRPKVTTGALLFGSALDNALNVLLTEKDKDPFETFEKSFRFAKVNDDNTYIPTSPLVVYSNADFDSDLVNEEDAGLIKEQIRKSLGKEVGHYLEVYNDFKDRKKSSGFDSLNNNEKQVYNFANWLCLRAKGKLMIEVYARKVMPKLNKILAVQEYVTLSNGDGDTLTGFVDLVAEVEGYGRVILDNKTSSMDYEKDAVLTSAQLSLYKHILEEKYGTTKAGYIVLKKQVIKNKKKVCSVCGFDGSGGRHATCNNTIDKKRCGGAWNETIDPDIFVQFIIDEIPAMTEQIVLENIDNITENIKQGRFHRNLNSCTNYWGGNCPYLGLCYKGSHHGLLDLNKPKKDDDESIS